MTRPEGARGQLDEADRTGPGPAHARSVAPEPSTPPVTICVPAFNAERYLATCLDSLAAQTYPNRTIVVSDNASTDRTGEIARSHGARGVRYVRNATNVGGPSNFNRCLTLAEGEYVAVYHADDVYHRSIVEREVRFLESHRDVGAVLSLDWWINERGEVWGGSVLPAELGGRDLYSFDELFAALLRRTNSFLRCPSVMLRRSVVKRVGGWREDAFGDAGDLDLWLRIALDSGLGILKERLVKYRVTRTQWSAKTDAGRTAASPFFAVMESYLARPELRSRVARADLLAYRAHWVADVVVRALRLAADGRTAGARRLVRDELTPRAVLWPASARVRAHILAGFVLAALLRTGLARHGARLMLAVRAHGVRSILRDRAPRLAYAPWARRGLGEWQGPR